MDKIVLIILTTVCLLGILYYLFIARGPRTYVAIDDDETKPSVYRGEEATALMTIIEYWLSDILPEESKPRVYASDDYTMGYINYTTQNGFLRCTVDWMRHKLYLHYSKHDIAEGGCIELRRTVRQDDETALVDFLLQARDVELSLAAEAAEWLEKLRDVALRPSAAKAMEEQTTGSFLITLWIFLTAYLRKQKQPDHILLSLYTQLATLLHQRYANELQEFVDTYMNHDDAEESDEETDVSEESNPSE